MREFSQLDATAWMYIQQGANNKSTHGTLADWPNVKAILDQCGIVLPLTATTETVRWACETAYWQAKADEFSACYNVVAEENRDLKQQAALAAEAHQALVRQYAELREAFRLQAEYAARPDPPPPPLLGGLGERPE